MTRKGLEAVRGRKQGGRKPCQKGLKCSAHSSVAAVQVTGGEKRDDWEVMRSNERKKVTVIQSVVGWEGGGKMTQVR